MSEFSYYTNYSVSSQLYDDADKWVTPIVGKVTCFDDEENELVIAKTKYYYVDLDAAIEKGNYPEYILDMEHATSPYISIFDIGFGTLNDDVLKILEYDEWSLNILILDRIEILPIHRGNNLGELLIQEAERLFSFGADIIVLKSFPLQFEFKSSKTDLSKWEKSLKLEKLESTENKAQESLSNYYKNLGFKDIGLDHVMVKLINS